MNIVSKGGASLLSVVSVICKKIQGYCSKRVEALDNISLFLKKKDLSQMFSFNETTILRM
jgi:hypothetical protein